MARFALEINGRQQIVDADPEMPLLWVLRDLLNMTGTKYGCGIGLCGACTVHIDGAATRSCQTPLATAAGRRIVTIEGLAPTASTPCRRHGSLNRFRSAATANPDRSCLPPHCSLANLTPSMPISTRPWPATSAVAPPTSAFATPSTVPQGRYTREHETQPAASQKQRRHLAPHLPRNFRGRRRSPGRRSHPSRPISPSSSDAPGSV